MVLIAGVCGGYGVFACSSFESSGDGQPTESDAATEAAVDATTESDAAGPPFCANVDASFCWSFDDTSGDPLLGPSLAARGVRPDLTDAALSAPNAMLVDYRVGETEKGVVLEVPKTTALRCELDFIVDAITTGGGNGVEIHTFISEPAFTPSPSLTIQSTDGKTVESSIFFLGGTPATVPLGNIAIGKWVHVMLETGVGDGGAERVRAELGGVSGETSWTQDGGIAQLGPYAVRVGLVNGFGAKPWTVRYDNVVCRWK